MGDGRSDVRWLGPHALIARYEGPARLYSGIPPFGSNAEGDPPREEHVRLGVVALPESGRAVAVLKLGGRAFLVVAGNTEPKARELHETIDEIIDAVVIQDWVGLWAMTSSWTRESVTPEEFANAMSQSRPDGHIVRITRTSEPRVEGVESGHLALVDVEETFSSGRTRTAIWPFEREGSGAWQLVATDYADG